MFIERMRDPVLVIDDDSGLVVEANAAALALTGRSRSALLRIRSTDLFTSAHGAVDVAPTDDEHHLVDVVRPDGSSSTVELFVGSPGDTGHRVLVLVDVSRQQAEEHQRSLQRSLDSLVADRQRLARDLHDGVVQEVIATGIVLGGLRDKLPDGLRSGVDELIDAQGRIVAMIRSSVLDLSQPLASSAGLEMTMREIVRQAVPSLGFVPETEVVGRSVRSLDAVLVGHIALSLREMLSNVARHAAATAARVTVRFDDGQVAIEVTDDGVGFDRGSRRGNGLANLAERARLLGGSFTIDSASTGGATATWTVPTRGPDVSAQ